MDGILAWGGLAFLNGVMGSVVGIILALQAVEAVGEFRGTAMAPGIKMSLLCMFFGALCFGIAILLWYGLHLRRSRLQPATTDASPE